LQLGEGFAGEGPNAAHVNTVLGSRDGPVGTAWATALATPRQGHAAFVVVLRPGVPTLPFTLFVNKATIESDTHATMTWGPAQAGVAAGVARAVERNVVRDVTHVLITAVWVNPQADDADAVFANNVQATIDALTMGQVGLSPPADIEVWNPFFTPQDQPATKPR